MDLLNNKLKNFYWSMDKPITNAYMVNPENHSRSSVPSDIFDFELPYNIKNSKITILSYNNEAVLTVNFNGNTFRDFLDCLYNGLYTPIKSKELTEEQREKLYIIISKLTYNIDREYRIRNLENDLLLPITLIDLKIWFGGNIKRRRGIWTYHHFSIFDKIKN